MDPRQQLHICLQRAQTELQRDECHDMFQRNLSLIEQQPSIVIEMIINALDDEDVLNFCETSEIMMNKCREIPRIREKINNLTRTQRWIKKVSGQSFSLAELINLKELDLSDNDIGYLPEGIFDGLKSLKELNLSVNEIEMLPVNIFEKLKKLERLDLSENYLENEEENKDALHEFLQLPHFKVLDLSDNDDLSRFEFIEDIKFPYRKEKNLAIVF